ncbi:hypothetical protein IC582_002479 [Cucumis melo]
MKRKEAMRAVDREGGEAYRTKPTCEEEAAEDYYKICHKMMKGRNQHWVLLFCHFLHIMRFLPFPTCKECFFFSFF